MRLEPVRRELAPVAYESLSDERIWTYFPHLRPQGARELGERFARWSKGPPGNNPLFTAWENWLAFTANDEIAGLFQATIMREHSALIAYSVVPTLWRQGYAREAVSAIIEHLQDAHDIAHIFADIHATNTPSIQLITSLGFKQISSGAEPRFALRTANATPPPL